MGYVVLFKDSDEFVQEDFAHLRKSGTGCPTFKTLQAARAAIRKATEIRTREGNEGCIEYYIAEIKLIAVSDVQAVIGCRAKLEFIPVPAKKKGRK